MLYFFALLGVIPSAFSRATHPPDSYHRDLDWHSKDSNITQQIFYGRFISTPTPDNLLIATGAVLVTSSDGTGYIQATAWDTTDPTDAAARLGVGADVPVIQAGDNGFFFPGFIGKNPHAHSSVESHSQADLDRHSYSCTSISQSWSL